MFGGVYLTARSAQSKIDLQHARNSLSHTSEVIRPSIVNHSTERTITSLFAQQPAAQRETQAPHGFQSCSSLVANNHKGRDMIAMCRCPDLGSVSLLVYTAARRKARLLTTSINPNNARFTTYPLLLVLPFLFTVLLQVAWLSHPEYNNSYILYSAAFVPFLCAWGLQFAHQVGRMILAHVTSTPFPVWDWIWVWSALAALDANIPRLFGRAPFLQTSIRNTSVVVWVTLVISFVAYARFVTLVIRDITEYLGIACFTVKKRDKMGVWRSGNGDEKRV